MEVRDMTAMSIYIAPRLKSRLQAASFILQKSRWRIVDEALQEFFDTRLTNEQRRTLDLVADAHAEIAEERRHHW